MRALRAESAAATQRIAYGVTDDGARARYERDFGCARWTEAALAAAAAYSPLIEIGAGRGHWQRALSRADADVLAFDNGSTPQPLAALPPVGKVAPGDESALSKHPDRTLLLVYPPPGDMALRCVRAYGDDVLVYVGEGRGGVNADGAFFAALEDGWQVERIITLDPFPECFERMFILRRKPQQAADPPSKQPATPAL
eukprot:TRINITY_DN1846_c0_g1_i1.p1 TRINITY_DN1846_c0_g1~~TRINITY_DN1846_c0_g1_i1.p1  ORF type:complete len:198 (-),score=82.38 TRINITY_DN1846_c0_g1_i1:355-948(-)